MLAERTCSVCGFLFNVQAAGEHKPWYNFIVECEHLFLRNIYGIKDFEKINGDIEKYYEIIDRLLGLFLLSKMSLMMKIY